MPPDTKSAEKEEILTLEVCEGQLRSLGLSDEQIEELGGIIDAISDVILDRYFAEFYD